MSEVFYCEVCERKLPDDIDFCDDCATEVGNE